MATYAPNQLHAVPLAELQPDPTQPRKYLDPLALEELTASVGQVGIIEPIVCRQDPKTALVYVVNKLPKEIRDECRKDPTVPKKVLVAIARNKQQRSMVTQFQLYRKQQAQAGVKKTPGAKRTKAEALVNNFGATQMKIAALDLQEFSTEDRDMIMETLTSLKNTLEEALAGATNPSKNLA